MTAVREPLARRIWRAPVFGLVCDAVGAFTGGYLLFSGGSTAWQRTVGAVFILTALWQPANWRGR